jgi:hypothetical protein
MKVKTSEAKDQVLRLLGGEVRGKDEALPDSPCR